MICIVQCSRKIAVFLSFMPITDLKSGGKMERMNFVRPVLNARCSCALVGHKLCFLVIFLISTATYLVIENLSHEPKLLIFTVKYTFYREGEIY